MKIEARVYLCMSDNRSQVEFGEETDTESGVGKLMAPFVILAIDDVQGRCDSCPKECPIRKLGNELREDFLK